MGAVASGGKNPGKPVGPGRLSQEIKRFCMIGLPSTAGTSSELFGPLFQQIFSWAVQIWCKLLLEKHHGGCHKWVAAQAGFRVACLTSHKVLLHGSAIHNGNFQKREVRMIPLLSLTLQMRGACLITPGATLGLVRNCYFWEEVPVPFIWQKFFWRSSTNNTIVFMIVIVIIIGMFMIYYFYTFKYCLLLSIVYCHLSFFL